MMYIERNLILARPEEHVRALQTPVNANDELKVLLMDAMAKIRELLKNGCSIDFSDYSVNFLRLAREVQRLSDLDESKDLELQKMAGLVDNASRLQENFSKLRKKSNRSTAVNNVVLALRTEVSEFKTTTGSIVGFLQRLKARALKTERDLKKAQETTTLSGFCEQSLKRMSRQRRKSHHLYIWNVPTFVLTWMNWRHLCSE